MVVPLLKWMGPKGAEKAFERLDEEPSTSQRLRLIRLIGQLGPNALEVGRSRLGDNRWYVVRNACSILSSVGDPDLAAQLSGALRHPDGRVQQRRLLRSPKAVPGSRRGAGQLAPYLQPHLLELALDHMVILKEPAAVTGLEGWIFGGTTIKTGTLAKAVQALAVIPSEPATEALARILSDGGQVPAMRKAAVTAWATAL